MIPKYTYYAYHGILIFLCSILSERFEGREQLIHKLRKHDMNYTFKYALIFLKILLNYFSVVYAMFLRIQLLLYKVTGFSPLFFFRMNSYLKNVIGKTRTLGIFDKNE